jgi:hypothetical protein
MYEFALFRPGVEFNRKGEPLAIESEIVTFQAKSSTEARTIAAAMYRETGLGVMGHYNVSRAS